VLRSQPSLNKAFVEVLGELFALSGYATIRPIEDTQVGRRVWCCVLHGSSAYWQPEWG
jgi:hypothetical protein